MGVKVAKKNLQTDKYTYTWNRDKGDGEYSGILDQIKVDKDEGYEVLYFIQTLMNKHGLKTEKNVHDIEDALHDEALSSIVKRDELEKKIETILAL